MAKQHVLTNHTTVEAYQLKTLTPVSINILLLSAVLSVRVWTCIPARGEAAARLRLEADDTEKSLAV